MDDITVMDLRKVDLNLLVSLDVLLAERNVTRAAQRLHISQPALSAQLARLRELLDDHLLLPGPRSMVPTARALELAAPLSGLLKELGLLLQSRRAFDPKSEAHTFVIAATDYGDYAVILPLAQRLAADAPRVRIATRAYESARISTQLESGEVDLLLASSRMTPPGMLSREILQERFVFVQRKGHPRGRGRLTLERYCTLEHVLVSTSGGSFTGFMDEILAQRGVQRSVRLSVQQFLLVPQILATSDLVCTLPARLAHGFAHVLDQFPLPFDAPGFSLFAAWHPRSNADLAHRWLRGELGLAPEQE